MRYFDAHVHLHPPRLAAAIERWFAQENWHNAHPFEPEAVAETLRARGVERFCFFTYAHKPGMARDLNHWVAEIPPIPYDYEEERRWAEARGLPVDRPAEDLLRQRRPLLRDGHRRDSEPARGHLASLRP